MIDRTPIGVYMVQYSAGARGLKSREKEREREREREESERK